MLWSFRVRLLVVIAILTLVGYSLQSGNWSRNWVEPALRVILHEDQCANQILAAISDRLSGYQLQPAASDQVLQLPGAYTGVVRPFGNSWDASQNKAVLFPGILLQVNSNTAIKAVLPGKVTMIQGEAGQYKVQVEHQQGLTSEYGQLDRVLVRTGQTVSKDTVIGRSGEQLYFAINSPQGPLDPGHLFP